MFDDIVEQIIAITIASLLTVSILWVFRRGSAKIIYIFNLIFICLRRFRFRISIVIQNQLPRFLYKLRLYNAVLNRFPKLGWPRKLDKIEYNRLKDMLEGDRKHQAIDEIYKLSKNSLPSDNAIDDILGWLEPPTSDFLQDERITFLNTLKMFCENGLKVGQPSITTKDEIVSVLQKIAFDIDENYEITEMAHAFDNIDILNVKDQVSKNAMKFCYLSLKCGFVHKNGNHFTSVSDWLAKDPSLKADLCKNARDLMLNENIDAEAKSRCRNFRNRKNC